MGSWVRENTYVCLDDITCKREDLNPVIYNPRMIKDITERKNILYKYILERCGVELSDSDLEILSHYEVSDTFNSSCCDNHSSNDMLSEFIQKLRLIVRSK